MRVCQSSAEESGLSRPDHRTNHLIAPLLVALIATIFAVQPFFSQVATQPGPGPTFLGLEAGGDPVDSDRLEEDLAEPAPDPIMISLTLERSVSLASYLSEAGLEQEAAGHWAQVFYRAVRTRVLRAGHEFAIFKDPESGELRGLRYDVDDRWQVVERDLGAGVIVACQHPIEYVTRPVRLAFAINESFLDAARSHQVPQSVAKSLADALGSKHLVGRLGRGSAVKLIYQEEVSRDGRYHVVDGLLAAQINTGNGTLNAFALRDEQGRVHLYEGDGQALEPQFLKFPVSFEYVSSGFGYRYHPVLHRYRSHDGVDLVARYGTPVRAVADGRVETAGWCGQLGRCVRVEHERGIVSVYGHLSRISSDVREGAYVKLGQRIGQVGSSGLSTGPHLHFALLRKGNYVNPLTQNLAERHQVSPRLRALFEAIKRRYQAELAKLPDLSNRFSLKWSARRGHKLPRAEMSGSPAGGRSPGEQPLTPAALLETGGRR